MRASSGGRRLATLMMLGLVAACSGDGGATTGNGSATLAVVNALAYGVGAKLRLDAAGVTLPVNGQATTLTVGAGSHRVQLLSVAGAPLIDTTFALSAGTRRAVVFTGHGDISATVSIATDTNSTGPNGNGYRSTVGSILLVNSAPNTGPFDVLLSWGTDSVARLGGFAWGSGSLPPPSPYSYYLPFEPGQFTVRITNPGGNTALVSTTFPLAISDRWSVILTNSIEGELTLIATRQ